MLRKLGGIVGVLILAPILWVGLIPMAFLLGWPSPMWTSMGVAAALVGLYTLIAYQGA